MYANCRGLKRKQESLKEIVENIDPDIIILNETMYRIMKKQLSKHTNHI